MYKSKKEINKDLYNLNQYFNALNEDNNIEELNNYNSIVSKKEKYIDNYIYNSIVNHALYKYDYTNMLIKNHNKKDKITIDDVIQEIAFLNNDGTIFNDKQRRKRVLDNYFKSHSNILKFPTKYKMEKALKNINYEMEKATEEFSKLFNYDDKKM